MIELIITSLPRIGYCADIDYLGDTNRLESLYIVDPRKIMHETSCQLLVKSCQQLSSAMEMWDVKRPWLLVQGPRAPLNLPETLSRLKSMLPPIKENELGSDASSPPVAVRVMITIPMQGLRRSRNLHSSSTHHGCL